MSTPRTRTAELWKTITGYVIKPQLPLTTVQSGRIGSRIVCDDATAERPYPDHPLNINFYRCQPSIMDGEREILGKVYTKMEHVPMLHTSNHSVIPDPGAVFPYPDFASERLRWLAAMNPSKPAFLLPAFIGEFRDFPSMLTQVPNLIKGWGGRLLSTNPSIRARAADAARAAFKDVGSAHLGVQFGWSPFLRDLATLFGFLKELQQRLLWLLELMAGGTIKRRLQLAPERLLQEPGQVATQSNGALVTQNRVFVYNARSWVTTRWSPLIRAMYTAKPFKDVYAQARSLTLGYGAWGLLLAWWELLPWSWLTDWFCNVGRRLGAVANGLLLKLDSFCYCRTSTVDCYFSVTSKPSWLTIKGSDYLYRCRKERKVLDRSDVLKPTPSLPALTGSQAGILGALFASRF